MNSAEDALLDRTVFAVSPKAYAKFLAPSKRRARVAQAADAIGIRGIVVHALSEEAKKFYLALGFDASPREPMTLMVTLPDIRAAL